MTGNQTPRGRAAYAQIAAEHQAVVRALGRQGWVALLTRRRAQRTANARARRLAGLYQQAGAR